MEEKSSRQIFANPMVVQIKRSFIQDNIIEDDLCTTKRQNKGGEGKSCYKKSVQVQQHSKEFTSTNYLSRNFEEEQPY